MYKALERRRIGLIGLAGLELELADLLGGYRVDLRTPAELSPHFRDEAVRVAKVLYSSE